MEKSASPFNELTDTQLLSEVKVLVAREREATAALIRSLAEVEARELYLGLGYPSLFRYCTDELQLSRAAAFSRIRAARTLQAFPAAIDHLAGGSITLTNLNVLSPHLTADNHVALLNAAQYQTKEEVERQVAELSPGAEMLVTMHVRVHVDVRSKLRRAQELMRHLIPDGNTSDVLERALTLLIADLEKKKLSKVRRPKRPAKMESSHSKYIPAWMKRTVWRRDGGRCKFVGAVGRCPETGGLEFHHVRARAQGGTTTVRNLELRCKPHNLFEAEIAFGSTSGVPYGNSS